MNVKNNAAKLADELSVMVLKRTGLRPQKLICPREKSEMTPCVVRDGRLAAVDDDYHGPICIGCERGLQRLLDAEMTARTFTP